MLQNILVVRPGALGDTILTLPALAALRQAYPSTRLTFAGNPAVLPLLADSPYASATLSIDHPALAPMFDTFAEPPAELVALLGPVDLAVLWLRDHAAAAQNLRLIGAHAVIAAPSRPPSGGDQHISDYLLATLHPLPPSTITALRPSIVRECPNARHNMAMETPATRVRGEAASPQCARMAPPPSPFPRLFLTPDDVAFGTRFHHQHALTACTVVALHPGSGGRSKCWPAERFVALADLLADRGLATLLIAGPADDEPIRAFQAGLRRAQPVLATGLAIRELAAVLATCAAFVGNDSGVSHLAAALGVPTVAIYGPTDPRVWGIRGKRVTLVKGEGLEDVTVDAIDGAVTSYLFS